MTERAGQQAGLPPATHRRAPPPVTSSTANPPSSSSSHPSRGEAGKGGLAVARCMHRNGNGDGSLVRRLRRLVSRCTRAAARTGGDVNSRAHAEASELAFEFLSTQIMRKENMLTMDGLINKKSFKEAVLAFSIWADGRAL